MSNKSKSSGIIDCMQFEAKDLEFFPVFLQMYEIGLLIETAYN